MVKRQGQHEQGIGETGEVRSADEVDGLHEDPPIWRHEVDVYVAHEILLLQSVELFVLNGLNVIFVREPDHGENFVGGVDNLGFGSTIAEEDLSSKKARTLSNP